jgi:DNA-binding winged helix-turn-helix (wHTH) protein/Flp pilus assembly protein TadD
MLKLVDLANRRDFSAGPLRVSPATRTMSGPGGSASLEPIVMKVLLLLLDAHGAVVTRDELFANAWGGVFVGDDSLNRAVGRARKVLSEVAPGSFEIETIPRTGYRLTGDIEIADEPNETAAEQKSAKVSRRRVIGVGAGMLVTGAAGAGLWATYSRNQERFDDLLRRGEQALEYGDNSADAAEYLRRAVAIRPTDAAAQGLLAFALAANADNGSKTSSGLVDEAQQAANISLRAQPEEANARLAFIELQRLTLDLAGTEDRLRQVLATAPDNIFAMRELWDLLQSAGRSRDALALVRRAIAVKPLAAANNFPLAQLLWIVGRTSEADRVIDRAMEFWPAHPVVRFARFTILAFTGRPRAALAMLNRNDTRPQIFSPARVALWRVSLPAMDDPSPANVARARAANVDAAKADVRLASQAVTTLCVLGEVDAAFDVANALFVFSTPDAGPSTHTIRQPRANSIAWRFTPWLFIPPAAPLHADPRFATLADGIGLTAYWRARNVRPDYQLFG